MRKLIVFLFASFITFFVVASNPNVSKQVVLFPLLHKELTESEFEMLKPKICKAFIIQNIGTDASEFLQTEPENLIKTYDELYAN